MTARNRTALMATLLDADVLFGGCEAGPGTTGEVVRPVSEELGAELGLAPFYPKSVVGEGV